MQDDSWSTVNTRSTFTSVSTYTEDMTARPSNNPMESQGIMGEGELQFNIGASDMDHMVSPPRYTEQRSVPEPRVETSEKNEKTMRGDQLPSLIRCLQQHTRKNTLLRHQERRGMAMDNQGTKVRRCVGSSRP
jgi:hypothetical protein